MPTISVFYGIVITMYWNDHVPQHVHRLGVCRDQFFVALHRVVIRDIPTNHSHQIAQCVQHQWTVQRASRT